MNDRDVSVMILALVVAIVAAVLDTLVDIEPVAQDGVLSFALIISVAWGFYRLRG